MKDINKLERSFELHSEKVRNIVGQIPSSFIRYGIITIVGVLGCLFVVAYFLPYKQIYSGTAVIHNITISEKDSIYISIMLKFENKRLMSNHKQNIFILAHSRTVIGQIGSLSNIRDTLGYQQCLCRFKSTEIKSIENQTVDFQIVKSSGNLLQKMLGDMK